MKRLLGAAVVMLWPAMAPAQEAAMPEGCRILDSSKFIRVMVCTPPLGNEDLARAGKLACGELVPCGAWIWAQEADAPATAPENHDGLTQAQVTSSRGVWVAEQGIFIGIEEATK